VERLVEVTICWPGVPRTDWIQRAVNEWVGMGVERLQNQQVRGSSPRAGSRNPKKNAIIALT
jgi:hypothetical protein